MSVFFSVYEAERPGCMACDPNIVPFCAEVLKTDTTTQSVFLAVSSNTLYQIINGLEWLVEDLGQNRLEQNGVQCNGKSHLCRDIFFLLNAPTSHLSKGHSRVIVEFLRKPLW